MITSLRHLLSCDTPQGLKPLRLLNVTAQKTFSRVLFLPTSYANRGRVLLSVGRAITANYGGTSYPPILCTLTEYLKRGAFEVLSDGCAYTMQFGLSERSGGLRRASVVFLPVALRYGYLSPGQGSRTLFSFGRVPQDPSGLEVLCQGTTEIIPQTAWLFKHVV